MNQLALDLRDEKRRLSKQCAEILHRLELGPTSNYELVNYALKYTGRISELRKKGHDIRIVERDHVTGTALYAVFVNGRQVP